MELFRLFGSILIDNKDAISALQKTEEKAKKTSDGLGGIVSSSLKVGTAVVAGATAAAGGLMSLATKASSAASNIDDASQRVGMGAEEYQKWTYAAKLSGLEADKLEAAMKKQQTVFANATEGNKAAAEAYQKLGINIQGLSSGEAFNQVITQLAGMTDETQRNALANDIFGKSYADLGPLLNTGAEGIAALKQEAVEVGAVMSEDSVAAGAKFGDTLDKLMMSFDGLVNQIGGELLPFGMQLMDGLIAAMPQINAILMPILKALVPLIGQIFTALKPVVDLFINYILPPLIQLIQEVLPAIMPIITLLIQYIVGMMTPAFKVLGSIVSALVPIFKTAFQAIYNIVKPILNFIIDGMNLFIKGLNSIKIPSWVPLVGGKGINLPEIPRLRTGMDYVPYDNFPAILHQGERVLTAEENKNYGQIDYDLLGASVARQMKNITIVLDKDIVGEFVDSRILKGAY